MTPTNGRWWAQNFMAWLYNLLIYSALYGWVHGTYLITMEWNVWMNANKLYWSYHYKQITRIIIIINAESVGLYHIGFLHGCRVMTQRFLIAHHLFFFQHYSCLITIQLQLVANKCCSMNLIAMKFRWKSNSIWQEIQTIIINGSTRDVSSDKSRYGLRQWEKGLHSEEHFTNCKEH